MISLQISNRDTYLEFKQILINEPDNTKHEIQAETDKIINFYFRNNNSLLIDFTHYTITLDDACLFFVNTLNVTRVKYDADSNKRVKQVFVSNINDDIIKRL